MSMHEQVVVEPEDPALLNANITMGARLMVSAVVFLFMSFVFAFFYLRALNSNHSFVMAHVKPPDGWGVAVLACVLGATAVFEGARRQLRDGTGGAWRLGAGIAVALVAGRRRRCRSSNTSTSPSAPPTAGSRACSSASRPSSASSGSARSTGSRRCGRSRCASPRQAAGRHRRSLAGAAAERRRLRALPRRDGHRRDPRVHPPVPGQVIAAALALIADAGTNATAAGPLTLAIPVGVLIVVLAIWWAVWRRRRART